MLKLDENSDCATLVSSRWIKLEDSGKSINIGNSEKNQFLKVRVDGCLMKGIKSADFFLLRNGADDGLFVELKGSKIDYGIDQIISSAQYFRSKKIIKGKMSGLVVGRQYPKATTKIQKKIQQFRRANSGSIWIFTSLKSPEFNSLHS